MVRSIAFIIVTASLLLWSAQVYSDSPQVFPMTEDDQTTECVSASSHCPHCPVGHHHALGHTCPLGGLRHQAGQSGPPAGYAVSHRLGHGTPCPLKAQEQAQAQMGMQPMPFVPQPPGGFFGGAFMPRQYPMQPMPYPPMAYPPGQYPMMPPPMGYGNAQSYGYSGPVQERIVYVPYAAPPPIQVERLGKALPMPPLPRTPMIRRMLGDANIYEYPEMPLHLYTTRGPRDFLAPNPPGIGE